MGFVRNTDSPAKWNWGEDFELFSTQVRLLFTRGQQCDQSAQRAWNARRRGASVKKMGREKAGGGRSQTLVGMSGEVGSHGKRRQVKNTVLCKRLCFQFILCDCNASRPFLNSQAQRRRSQEMHKRQNQSQNEDLHPPLLTRVYSQSVVFLSLENKVTQIVENTWGFPSRTIASAPT